MTPAPLHPHRDPQWLDGDRLIERFSGLSGAKLRDAKIDAACEMLLELNQITRLITVCRTFPPGRRVAVSFEHHEAVMKLSDDEDRQALLSEAAANGWSAKRTRKAVLAKRIAVGAYQPPEDDDPEDTLFRAAAQACNRSNPNVRRMLVESLEEADFGVILL